MLPGFPLDGGRVLRSAVWARNKNRLRATRTAAHVGEWIAYGMMAIGVAESVFISPFAGIWMLMIGFFLKNAAASSYTQLVVETTLDGITVRDVMKTSFDSVAPDVSVDELVHDYVLRQERALLRRDRGGRLRRTGDADRRAQAAARGVGDDQRVSGDDAGDAAADGLARTRT